MEKQTKTRYARILETLQLLTVEPYIFFSLFGYVVRLASYQDFLMDRACRNELGYPEEVCDNLFEHKEELKNSIRLGNNFYTGFMLLLCIPASILVIFIGPWSDKYSRKWPMSLAVVGMFIESAFTCLLAINKNVPSKYFMLLGLFSGVSGGYLVATSAASSYLSDITDIRSRAIRFAILDFFTVLASVVGTAVGGQVYKAYGHWAVLNLAPLSMFVAFLYLVLFVKEIKPPIDASRRTEMFKDLFTLDNIKQSYRTCVKPRYGNIRLQIWVLVWVECIYKLIVMGTLSILFPFTRKMYNMDVTEYSNANTIFPTVQAFLTVVTVPLLSQKLFLHEAAIGLIGVLSMAAKMVLLSVSYSVPYFYFAMLTGTLCNISSIAVRSRLSKIVAKEELGRTFALLGIFTAISPIVGTVLFFQIYNASLDSFTGLAFTSAAVLLIPSALIFMWMVRLPTVFVGDYAKEEEMTITNTVHQRLDNDEERF